MRLPHALPEIFTGLKVGAAISATAAVVAEFVASDRGLGYLLLQYNGDLNTPMVFATVMVLGAIGLVVYFAVEMMERLVIPWHASQTDRRGELGARLNNNNGGNMIMQPDARGVTGCMLAAPAWADDAVSLRLNWYMGGAARAVLTTARSAATTARPAST